MNVSEKCSIKNYEIGIKFMPPPQSYKPPDSQGKAAKMDLTVFAFLCWDLI